MIYYILSAREGLKTNVVHNPLSMENNYHENNNNEQCSPEDFLWMARTRCVRSIVLERQNCPRMSKLTNLT